MKKLFVDTVQRAHPVQNSIHLVFSILMKEYGFEHVQPKEVDFRWSSPTNLLAHRKLPYGKNNLYLLKTPLVNLECWEALARGVPAIILEEHFARKNIKDVVAKGLLRFYKKYPFIAQTRKTKEFLEELGATCFLIPPAEKKKRGAKKRKHILFVGKLLGTKNPFLFLRLAEAFPKEKFVMIGKGELEGKVREAASGLNNVEVIPRAENLSKYYCEAKLFIHPAWKDPIGHVIIEALSAQTPVLASSKAGASDFLPKEWIAEPGNEQEWIKKTRAILENQEGSVKEAEKIFKKEHLGIDDPYFEKVAEEIAATLKKRWPKLFAKG